MAEITVQTVLDWLNAFAPFESAEAFDNVGLLLGDPAARITTVLFGLDATPEMVAQARAIGAELIVAHHPLIFSPLRRIDYTSPQGQALKALMNGGMHVIAAHTNWDKAEGGVSDALTHALGLSGIQRRDDYLRIGTLAAPLTIDALSALIQKRLHILPRIYGAAVGPVSTVAVAGGAYGEGAAGAYSAGAQVFVTGEVKHHELIDACARGLVVCEAGHYATEAPGIEALYQRFLADAAASLWQVNARLYDNAPYAGAQL